MLEITRLQLTLDVPAQTTRDAIKTASRLLEMLQKQLSPVLKLYPPAGLAFGGLCLVLRVSVVSIFHIGRQKTLLTKLVFQIVGFAITSQEEVMKGLSHIAHAFDWYLKLSASSVLQCQAGKRGDAAPPLRPMLVNLFSTMLEY